MEARTPVLKKLDQAIFTQVDEFKKTSAHSQILEFYGGLEDEGQKLFKWILLLATVAIPFLLFVVLWFQNSRIEAELNSRIALVERMQQIITQNTEVGGLATSIAAPSAFTSEDELTDRVTNSLRAATIDVSKVRISNFTSDAISPLLTRSEADFKFEGLTTDQLVGMFTMLLQRERFRVSAVEIQRNSGSNLLDGTFHAIHFGETQLAEEE